jgi:predicted ATP-dependent endonuclease of OLD family
MEILVELQGIGMICATSGYKIGRVFLVKLYSFKIEGFRRHLDTEVFFSDATFLIGENNIGKSSVLFALNYLLNDIKKIPEEEFFMFLDDSTATNVRGVNKIVLTAEFREVPEEARQWRGFKGRVLRYNKENGEVGYRVVYRKTFEPNTDYVVEMLEQPKHIKPQFKDCNTLQELIDAGLDTSPIADKLKSIDPTKKLSTKALQILGELEDALYDYDETSEDWFENPGGIPANVLSRLPKFLLIPAQDKTEELSGQSGTLIKTLVELFNDVRDASDNFKEAQKYLELLAAELDPDNADSEFGKMMQELNGVLEDVFPNTGLKARTTLSDADKAIKPQFQISMYSNVVTPVSLQGTGMIRSAVFALLRYRNMRESRKTDSDVARPLIVGFEEPEIYLHPNAANQMRDTIYELAAARGNQIVCTTHSPYMIDLSKKPSQILNNLFRVSDQIRVGEHEVIIEKIQCFAFNTSEEFRKLQAEDQTYVKMLLKVDDYIAKVFFVKNVLIIEGDTEDIVLRESLQRMPESIRKRIESEWQIVKARGKATIISLVKYLKAMGIQPYVIHDEDKGNEKAESYNRPILEALGDSSKRVMLSNCIEDVLGYPAPSNEKPYYAYKHISGNWGDSWDTLPQQWKDVIYKVFSNYFKELEVEAHMLEVASTSESPQNEV